MANASRIDELEDSKNLQFYCGSRFQVNSFIQYIFNKTYRSYSFGLLDAGFVLTTNALMVMPCDVQFRVFEYLNLNYLVELWKIDQNSFENIDTKKLLEKLIKSRLKKYLPSDWLEEGELEKFLNLFYKLYSLRNDRYSAIFYIENLEECIELLIQSPLIMLEILHGILFGGGEVIECEIELMLKIVFLGEENINNLSENWLDNLLDNIYDKSEYVEEIIAKCMLIAAKSKNVILLNLLNVMGLEASTFKFTDLFWDLITKYYSRDFIKRLMKIKLEYHLLDTRNRIEAVTVLRRIILVVIEVGDFQFIKEIVAIISDDLKQECLVVVDIIEYIQGKVERGISEALLLELNSTCGFLLDNGFRYNS